VVDRGSLSGLLPLSTRQQNPYSEGMIPNRSTLLVGYRNPDEWKHGHPQKWLSPLSDHGYTNQLGTPADSMAC